MKFRLTGVIILSLLLIAACKKQSDNVFFDSDGALGFDGYLYNNQLDLLTRTVREDSLKSDSLSHNLIGIINDPNFGTYKASSFFQFRLPQLNNVLSANTLDSVVLMMQYTSTIANYGDLSSTVSLDVYELTEAMGSAVTHSNQTYAYNASSAASYTGRFAPSDSTNVRQGKSIVRVAPTLKIKLGNTLANKLFNATSTDLSSQTNFLNFFKGIAVVPKGNSQVISAFNLKGTHSKIRIYYNDSMYNDFKVTDESERFTKYEFNSLSPEILKQRSAAKTQNFDTTYVLAMGGSKMHIQLPNLFSIIKDSSKRVVIGKAELFIRPVAGTFQSPFTLPTRLLCFQPNPVNNTNAGILDLTEFVFGGDLNKVTNTYKINITRHIQNLFVQYQSKGDNLNRGLFITIPSDNPIAPSRLMIDTRKGLENAGIEFKLYYTEL